MTILQRLIRPVTAACVTVILALLTLSPVAPGLADDDLPDIGSPSDALLSRNREAQIGRQLYFTLIESGALITDPREAAMPPAGLVTLEDAETGATRLVDTRSKEFRADLARRSAQRQKDLADQLRATGMDLVAFDASGSMVDPLLKFFRERERRLRR